MKATNLLFTYSFQVALNHYVVAAFLFVELVFNGCNSIPNVLHFRGLLLSYFRLLGSFLFLSTVHVLFALCDIRRQNRIQRVNALDSYKKRAI